MNNSYVYCVLEDRRGNFWFGTDGGGVSCYDGTSMSHYTMEEGLINNSIDVFLKIKVETFGLGQMEEEFHDLTDNIFSITPRRKDSQKVYQEYA
jgi:hypothetical protein